MKLPPSFFYKFFKENTFFLIDSTIYMPKEVSKNNNLLLINGKRFGISENLTLSRLEELYFSNNQEAIKNFGNNLLKNIQKDEKKLNEDYYRLGEELELAEFVLNDVIKKTKKKNKIGIIKSKKDAIIINRLIQQDLFVWSGKLYPLFPGKKGIWMELNNTFYNINNRSKKSLEKIEEEYQEGIRNKIYNKLTKGQNSLLKKIEDLNEKKSILTLIKKGDFFNREENIGFKKEKNNFFITTQVKPYVLYETKNKQYYRFDGATIGVKLKKDGAKIKWFEPLILDSYIHPALPSAQKKDHQKICNGNLNYQKLTEGKPLEQGLRNILAESRRMITSGYFGAKGAWHSLTEKQFQ